MIKFRKKLLAVLLTAAMLISMSSVVAWSDEQPADEQTTQTEQTTEEDNTSEGEDSKDDKKDEEDVPRTDEEGLAEMKVIAENSNYKLYLNEKTTNFAIQSKSDNYVWWSNPLNADKDPNAKSAQKKNMQSPFYVVYGDTSTHTPAKLNAYEGSIKSKKFTIEEVENGVKIVYTLNKIGAEIPLTITLCENNVKATIVTSEIKEHQTDDSANIVILDIGLFQFFNAGSMDDNGYMFVPDGSGAIINYNNRRVDSQAYYNEDCLSVLQRQSRFICLLSVL